MRQGQNKNNGPTGVGTMLVSKKPFSESNLDTIEEISKKMQFDIVLSPRVSIDPTLAVITSGRDLEGFTTKYPLNIVPPTDNKPFFFTMLKLQNIFDPELWRKKELLTAINIKAFFVLGTLLITVVGLTFLFIIVPLILTTNKQILNGTLPFFIFFASIGFGFMLVEISQMQRLIIFLGHPVYALSVVLFTLLLSSGLGSYSTQKISNHHMTGSATIRLMLLLCILFIFGILTPLAINQFQGSITMLRILIAVGILFPIGLFMGMAFPIGMKIASNKSFLLTPWLWGINGATSVCASVFAVVISIFFGISASFWTGFMWYIVAFIAFLGVSRKKN
jgi:hypothetical protein